MINPEQIVYKLLEDDLDDLSPGDVLDQVFHPTCVSCGSRETRDDTRMFPRGAGYNCAYCGQTWTIDPNQHPLGVQNPDYVRWGITHGAKKRGQQVSPQQVETWNKWKAKWDQLNGYPPENADFYNEL